VPEGRLCGSRCAQVAGLTAELKRLEHLLHEECQAHIAAEQENEAMRQALAEVEQAASLAVEESANLQQVRRAGSISMLGICSQ
jgi:hypothetical protein